MKNYIPGDEYHSWQKIELSPAWVKSLPENPIPHLIRNSPPQIRYITGRDALGLPDRHPLLRKILKHIPHEKPFQTLIRSSEKVLNTPPHEIEGIDFLQSLERLQQYMLNGANLKMYPVKSEIIRLLDRLDENGRFPLLYHHHAHACWLLLKLGLAGNRLLDKAIIWIMKRQRDDGGWLHRSMVKKGSSFETQSSCIWITSEVLQLLCARYSFAKTKEVSKGIEFISKRLFHESSTVFLKSYSPWDTFKIGESGDSMFTGGSLKIFECAVQHGYGFKHPLIDKLYSGLLFTQMGNGYFPAVKSKKPIKDPMATVRILSLIRKLHLKES